MTHRLSKYFLLDALKRSQAVVAVVSEGSRCSVHEGDVGVAIFVSDRDGRINGRRMSRRRAETVNLFRLTHADLLEKLPNTDALIPLKVNYFAVLLMFNNRTIAGEFLLQRAHEKLLIELFSDTLKRNESARSSAIATDLNGSQGFPSAT